MCACVGVRARIVRVCMCGPCSGGSPALTICVCMLDDDIFMRMCTPCV
jgi:hypothetical protein